MATISGFSPDPGLAFAIHPAAGRYEDVCSLQSHCSSCSVRHYGRFSLAASMHAVSCLPQSDAAATLTTVCGESTGLAIVRVQNFILRDIDRRSQHTSSASSLR